MTEYFGSIIHVGIIVEQLFKFILSGLIKWHESYYQI